MIMVAPHCGQAQCVAGGSGVARGGEVVRYTFVGRTMTLGYLENLPQF